MSAGRLSGEGHVTSSHQAALDARLRQSIGLSGLEGKPLHVQSMPFTADRDAQVAGMMGPPAWAVRLKRIHDGRTALKAKLDAAWADYARSFRDRPEEFCTRWRAYIAALDLSALNTLIGKHNAYYPIEARLPIMYPSDRYYVPTGIEWPQRLITAEQLLDEYPDDVDMALYFTKGEG